MKDYSRLLSKTWIYFLLAAGLAACTGATDPAEPTSLPAETMDVQPGPATETEPQTAPPTVPPSTEALTDTPPEPTLSPDLVLPDLGPAPDFTNEVWLNTEEPLDLETLRGKVVLVEFWTFG